MSISKPHPLSNHYIRCRAQDKGRIGVFKIRDILVEYWIVPIDHLAQYSGRYNGYAAFLSPVHDGRFDYYVRVHGGVTFHEQLEGLTVVGFDTAHYNSVNYPVTDIDWLKDQIYSMAKDIIMAHYTLTLGNWIQSLKRYKILHPILLYAETMYSLLTEGLHTYEVLHGEDS